MLYLQNDTWAHAITPRWAWAAVPHFLESCGEGLWSTPFQGIGSCKQHLGANRCHGILKFCAHLQKRGRWQVDQCPVAKTATKSGLVAKRSLLSMSETSQDPTHYKTELQHHNSIFLERWSNSLTHTRLLMHIHKFVDTPGNFCIHRSFFWGKTTELREDMEPVNAAHLANTELFLLSQRTGKWCIPVYPPKMGCGWWIDSLNSVISKWSIYCIQLYIIYRKVHDHYVNHYRDTIHAIYIVMFITIPTVLQKLRSLEPNQPPNSPVSVGVGSGSLTLAMHLL